jgi:hypothetical protein
LLLAEEEKEDTIVIERAGINTVKEFLLGAYLIKLFHNPKCEVVVVTERSKKKNIRFTI